MEEIIYTWILTKIDGTYLGWSKAPIIKDGDGNIKKPSNGDTVNMQWIEWNKPLPENIDSVQYKYENGELVIS